MTVHSPNEVWLRLPGLVERETERTTVAPTKPIKLVGPGHLAVGETPPAPASSPPPTRDPVEEARGAVRHAELLLKQARNNVTDPTRVKKLTSDLAKCKLDLAKALNYPPNKIQRLNDQAIVARVIWESAAAANPDTVVAYIRGSHLFMNNEAVDSIGQLTALDKNRLIRECGHHITVVNFKPGEIVYRKAPPQGFLEELCVKYPRQCSQPSTLARIKKEGPQKANITFEQLAVVKQEYVDKKITYKSDQEHWHIDDRWDEGEDGFGDCEDFAAYA